VLAVVAAVAIPGPAAAQAPVGDSVHGLGVAQDYGAFGFAVRSGSSGETPTGHAALGPLRQSPIACLAVTGNVARFDVVAGRITAMIEVTDNAGRGVPDVVRATSGLLEPANCAPLSPFALAGAVTDGDIVVVDTAPRPGTKEECKRGEWRRFGTFGNQGQCVRSVVSGPPDG
jgi:hypothetical protein